MIGRIVPGRLVGVLIALAACACGSGSQGQLKELHRARAGTVDVVLLASGDALSRGKSSATIEFRGADGSLLDVGTVRVNATMPMAGMSPMFAGSDVRPTETKGRYALNADFGMAGTWRLTVDWDGPAGRGSVSLPGTVR